MQTECSAGQLEFEAFDGRRVVAGFDGGAVTLDAGTVLLREADQSIGLTRRVSACFSDHRRADQVIHALPTLIGQRIVAIAEHQEAGAASGERRRFGFRFSNRADADDLPMAASPREIRQSAQRRRRRAEAVEQAPEGDRPDVLAADQPQPIPPLGIIKRMLPVLVHRRQG